MPGITTMAENNLRIAVLSGKGGTGKTLVSVNLAASALQSTYVDCDVEEPNGHLYFKPVNPASREIAVKIPVVDEKRCNGCRVCVDFCKFNALAYVRGQWKVFETVCHSCGGCVLFCPQKALSEVEKPIGQIRAGLSENVTVLTGILNTGETSGIPIVKELLNIVANEKKLTVIDCPPGSACIVMESIKEADYCILVAEPTSFGVHNLAMAHELVTLFGKPCGVVLNKCLDGDNPAERYCLDQNLKILDRIPFDAEIGTLNSNGQILVREDTKYWKSFLTLLNSVIKEARHAAITHS